jgi:putative Ca2+/H+ antiporter (TMEM165/GDT1 family)
MAAPPHFDQRFMEGLVKSLGVIGASEVGDKTFFIAAVMAMRHARLTVFAGALLALAVMTVLAVALGWAAPALVRGGGGVCDGAVSGRAAGV